MIDTLTPWDDIDADLRSRFGAQGRRDPDEEARYDWPSHARPEQLAPDGAWTYWQMLAGRGFGKTRALCEWFREQMEARAGAIGMLIAATSGDLHSVLLGGPSGIMNISPPWFMPRVQDKAGEGLRLTFPNGSWAYLRSADEPSRVRGPQFNVLAGDEFAAWRPKRGEHAWPLLQMGLRLTGPNGEPPQAALATTPKPSIYIRELLQSEHCATTRGSTYDNRDNLAPSFFDAVVSRYEGTRLGRQELMGELLDDVQGALWQQRVIDENRVMTHPALARVVVAIDPAATSHAESDETGILTAGRGGDGHLYVLEDRSGRMGPVEWARSAIASFDSRDGDRVIGEVNNGGEMVEHTLRTVRRNVPYTAVRASRGKVTRAEPIAALYEQGKVHHVGEFPLLEEQLTTWTQGDKSPDRLDALVWALTELSQPTLDTSRLGSSVVNGLDEHPWRNRW